MAWKEDDPLAGGRGRIGLIATGTEQDVGCADTAPFHSYIEGFYGIKRVSQELKKGFSGTIETGNKFLRNERG